MVLHSLESGGRMLELPFLLPRFEEEKRRRREGGRGVTWCVREEREKRVFISFNFVLIWADLECGVK